MELFEQYERTFGRPVDSEEETAERGLSRDRSEPSTRAARLGSNSGASAQRGTGTREEDEQQWEEQEGVRRGRVLRAPQRASQREREEHSTTHTFFRAWCDHCVRGRGMKMQHRSKTEEEKRREREEESAPRICMDYGYMSKQDEEEKKNPFS